MSIRWTAGTAVGTAQVRAPIIGVYLVPVWVTCKHVTRKEVFMQFLPRKSIPVEWMNECMNEWMSFFANTEPLTNNKWVLFSASWIPSGPSYTRGPTVADRTANDTITLMLRFYFYTRSLRLGLKKAPYALIEKRYISNCKLVIIDQKQWFRRRTTIGNSNMAIQTGSSYISERNCDR